MEERVREIVNRMQIVTDAGWADAPPMLSCQGGCDFRLDVEGYSCILCGRASAAAPGETAGRQEHEREQHEYAEQERQTRFSELNGPMVRIVHDPQLGNCPCCVVRVANSIGEKRTLAVAFSAWAMCKRQRFNERQRLVLNNFISKLDAFMKVHEEDEKHYGNAKIISAPGKKAIQELTDLCEPKSEIVPVQPAADSTSGDATDTEHLPDAVDVPGLEDDDQGAPQPLQATPVQSRKVSEGYAVDSIKKSCADQLQNVSNVTAFMRVLFSIRQRAERYIDRNDEAGSGASLFIENAEVGKFHPLLRRQLASDGGHVFSSNRLNKQLSIRKAVHVQTVAESVLEAMAADDESFDHATAVASKLKNAAVNDNQIAEILCDVSKGEVEDDHGHVITKRYCRGAVRYSRDETDGKVTFLKARRMCCDNEDCKQIKCIQSGIDIETVWNLHFRMLGSLVCSLKSRSNIAVQNRAVEIAIDAGKELFQQSRFFATRQSTFIGAATALVVRDGSNHFNKEELETLKHDLSVQAIATAIGFWHVYFEPCLKKFDTDVGGNNNLMLQFVSTVHERRKSFMSEKGNSQVDAVLMYRRALYMSKSEKSTKKDSFASEMSVGDSREKVPHLPSDEFGENVDLNRFADTVANCLSFARDSNLANTSRDNALVRLTESSQLSFDSLLKCVQSNVLGNGAYYLAEAGQRDLDNDEKSNIERFRPQRSQTLNEAVSNVRVYNRDVGVDNILETVTHAATRVEHAIPGFWKLTWMHVPALASLGNVIVISDAHRHPAGALLKRIDNSNYNFTSSAVQIHEVAASTPLQNLELHPKNQPVPTRDRSLDVVKRNVALETALRLLMHGSSWIYAPVAAVTVLKEKPKCDVNTAISSVVSGGNWKGALLNMYDATFLNSVLDFCDSAVTRLLDIKKANTIEHEDESTCEVLQAAKESLGKDCYAFRARDLHRERLESLLGLKVKLARDERFTISSKPRDAGFYEKMEYYISNQAQDDLVFDGMYGTPAYPKSKRVCLNVHSELFANAAKAGYDMLTLLIGVQWMDKDFNSTLIATTRKASYISEAIRGNTLETDQVASILKAVNSFAKQRRALMGRIASYHDSSVDGSETCAFIVPLANWFDNSRRRRWHCMDAAETLVSLEMERIQGLIDRAASPVCHVEDMQLFESVRGSGSRESERQLQYNASLKEHYRQQKLRYEKEYERAKLPEMPPAKFEDLTKEQKRRRKVDMIAESLTDVTGLEVYAMRGVVLYVCGAYEHECEGYIEPSKLLLKIFLTHFKSNGAISETTRVTVDYIMSNLVEAMVKLNTQKIAFEDVNCFYRQPVITHFLHEAAARYGTNAEKRAAKQIGDAGFNFMEYKFGHFPEIGTIKTASRFNDDEDCVAEDPEEQCDRYDRQHVQEVRDAKARAIAQRNRNEEYESEKRESARMSGAPTPNGKRTAFLRGWR
jgi:hypothetical protein